MSNIKEVKYQVLYLIQNAKANITKDFPEMNDNDIMKVSVLMFKEARSSNPMYTGNLNPKWSLYNEAINFLEELIER